MHRQWSGLLPRPVAFVFSGGASLGAIQVGMLRALRDAGLVPDLVVGTSVGAINAAGIAHYGMDRGIETLEAIWFNARRKEIFPGGLHRQVLCLLRTRQGLFNQRGLANYIDRYSTIKYIEDLPIPFGAVATDLATHRATLFRGGSLRTALLASAAIPGLYPPVEVDGTLYADGGLASNVPLRAAVELGAASLVVLDAGNTCRPSRVPTRIAEILLASFTATIRQRVLVEAPVIAERLPVLYLPVPCPVPDGLMDFDRAPMLIESAEAVAREFLERADPPRPGCMTGAPHYHDEAREFGRVIPVTGGRNIVSSPSKAASVPPVISEHNQERSPASTHPQTTSKI
jgi:NTE family protein